MDNDSVATAYTTVDGDFVHELEIKRSRFITYLRRVESEVDARALVAELRKKHFDARHHCSAFILGADRMAMRSNDDGEPSGTAGIPMLDALAKRETDAGRTDLSDVSAVVVRYFGGILLGAGGLVRAYSESVSSALDAAPLLRRERMRILGLDADHTAAGRLENDLRSAGVQVLGTDYGPSLATLRVALNDDAAILAAFHDRLATLTAGASNAENLGIEWVDVR
ncbi:YigZ family protein [Paeniglutamicibacter psychrophenolicus]|uniref:YigZ family protein n=1 Tax=Paeniglutamicibacter psychrophenolicus TaxID=257454 RepID=A0ABS4WFZ7_9MICC|nr:YigZ family protein [Paeniglutamicibacter psychrophenolicus]MBP2375139.1 putative YigZ family protein [Paeniglutamicibacter psychrophenolicus]